MLIEEIKNQLNIARRTKSPSLTVLSTLLSQCKLEEKLNKGITDDQILTIISKTIKNINETKSLAKNRRDIIDKCDFELSVITQFLPKQLGEEELTDIIINYANTIEKDKKAIGKIMSYLKEHYNGQYDGKLASSIIKPILS